MNQPQQPPPKQWTIKSAPGRAWVQLLDSFVHGNRAEFARAQRRYNATAIETKEGKQC